MGKKVDISELRKLQSLTKDFMESFEPIALNFDEVCKRNKIPKKLKKVPYITLLIIALIFCMIILPIIVSIVFFFPALHPFFEATFNAADLLQFEGTIIGSFFLFITVYITIQNNHKQQTIQTINSRIENFLKFIDYEIIKEGSEVPWTEIIDCYNSCYMKILEYYLDLVPYLPKKFKKYFEQNLSPHLHNFESKLSEAELIEILFNKEDENSNDFSQKLSFFRDYKFEAIASLESYLFKFSTFTNDVLYEIRENLRNI